MTWTTDRYPLPETIQYCTTCVMPNTRPGLHIHDDGECAACKAYKARADTPWGARWAELQTLCDQNRGDGTRYDCIVTVSSGKDSWYQVHLMRELRMTPLLLSVGNYEWTPTGWANLQRMRERFGCDLEMLMLPTGVARIMARKAFFKLLAPMWYWDRAVYSWPLQKAIQHGIKLIWYGEDINYQYGGAQAVEKASARDQMANDVVKPVPLDQWLGGGVERRHFIPHAMPTVEQIQELDPRYLSYYVPWSGYENRMLARSQGWHDLYDDGVERLGTAEDYDQIDAAGYMVHPWLKFPKFGHHHQSDVLSMWIREGRISRDAAVRLVQDTEHKLDPNDLRDFLGFTGITRAEFWCTVTDWANRLMLDRYGDMLRLHCYADEALERGGEMEDPGDDESPF